MALPSKPPETAVDLNVYQGVSCGGFAGKLSGLMVTQKSDVFGIGLNTLVVSSDFPNSCPMLDGGEFVLKNWIKIDRLCGLGVRKTIVGPGSGAALTNEGRVLVWGKGPKDYFGEGAVSIFEVYQPGVTCRICNNHSLTATEAGGAWLSYCDVTMKYSRFSLESPPPVGKPVKKFFKCMSDAIFCTTCMRDCSPKVMDGVWLCYCYYCNKFWELDESEHSISQPMGSFLIRIDGGERITDVAIGSWGFWMLTNNELKWKGFVGGTSWWRRPLKNSNPGGLTSIKSCHVDVFVTTDTGAMFRRMIKSDRRGFQHLLRQIPLGSSVIKVCCGRLASLCLLENGAVWIIYSGEFQLERLVCEDSTRIFQDIAAIGSADLFYVQSGQCSFIEKRHPRLPRTISVNVGERSCNALLYNQVQSGDSIPVMLQQRKEQPASAYFSSDAASATPAEHQPPHSELHSAVITSASVRPQSETHPPKLAYFQSDQEFITAAEHQGAEHVEYSPESLKSPTTYLVQRSSAAEKNEDVTEQTFNTSTMDQQNPAAQIPSIKPPTSEAVRRHSESSIQKSSSVQLPPFLSGLYGQILFADLALKLADCKFPAHRIILCTTSNYFRRKLTSAPDIQTVDVTVYNPKAYRCLLKYFYQLQPDNLDVDGLLGLLRLATSYEETLIAREVENKIKSKINARNASHILKTAKEAGFTDLQDECENFMRTDPDFKETLVNLAIQNLSSLMVSNPP